MDSIVCNNSPSVNDFERALTNQPTFKNSRMRTIQEIEQNLLLFSNFYAETFPMDTHPKWIIIASHRYKIMWDLWINLALLFITIVVPVRLAFSDDDPIQW